MEKFGQYILLEKVAVGGMAELFKAKKVGIEGFERVLAIKRILPHISSDKEFVDMFIAEAKLVAHLSHKNIAQIYDFGKIGENYFIALEYIRGKDLRTILTRCQEKNIRLPVDVGVFIAKEVLSALGYAHKQKDSAARDLNLIHRDISPQNILVSYEGEVKVIDFGIAKAETQSHTKTGMIKGKIAYMSPEQAWGRAIDHRSDIFSLGIVLYEMITGRRLFKGSTEINTLEMVREAKVEPFSPSLVTIVPSELESMVRKALSKDLKYRYQDASDMERDLGNILFVLSSTDSGAILKKFMNDLFCADIEAECKTAAEHATVSIKYDQKTIPSVKKVQERKPQAPQKREAQPEKKTFSYIILGAAFISIVVAVFLMWPNAISERVSHQLPTSDRIANPSDKAKMTPESGGQASPLSEQSIKHPEEPPSKDSPKPTNEEKIARKAPIELARGNLTINAKPWAEIYIDGQHYGTTPKTIKALKSGNYSVRLENPNYDKWTTEVTVSKGRTANVSHKFEGFGKIIVNAVPWGNVYLNGELKGQTPITIQKVPARMHEITISREGYTEVRKSVEIKTGSSEQVSVKLQRKN